MARCSIGRFFAFMLLIVTTVLLLIVISEYKNSTGEYTRRESLDQVTINEVETFLFFVGYPRSGHSIVASLVDAHPDAVIAHEFNLFPKLLQSDMMFRHLLDDRSVLYSALYQNSMRQAMWGWRSSDQAYGSKGYKLRLNSSSSWQGRFRRLRVIGDKSGGMTSRCYHDSPDKFMHAYQELEDSVKVPIKVLHVIRNPYDMISTKLLYRFSMEKRKKANYSSLNPIDNERHLMQAIRSLENEARAVSELINEHKLEILEIHIEDLIRNTKGTMMKICNFLHLECSADFLKMCRKFVFKTPSKSRTAVVWRKESKDKVDKLIHKYSFFSQYSF